MIETPHPTDFRMPAEWEPHQATWLAWPHQRRDWPGKFSPIPWVYVEIIRHLHHSELVYLLVRNPNEETRVRGSLTRAGIDLDRVRFFPVPTDRVWVRDSGPLAVLGSQGELALTDWHFNAWAKYDNWVQDDALPAILSEQLRLPRRVASHQGRQVVLEGGSIDVNGQGLLLTTEECLLSEVQCRNPGMSKEDLEKVLGEYLGVRQVLWLGRGIAGDDTHGHVDDLARFVAPNRVVTVVETRTGDENYPPLQENRERLRGMHGLNGRPLEVVELPMPEPIVFDGQRLPASYANFYIANEVVLVPTFNDAKDRQALGILAELFPDRRVVGIHCGDLIWGLGALHCMTQQLPRAEAERPAGWSRP